MGLGVGKLKAGKRLSWLLGAVVLGMLAPSGVPAQEIAFTWDDLPGAQRAAAGRVAGGDREEADRGDACGQHATGLRLRERHSNGARAARHADATGLEGCRIPAGQSHVVASQLEPAGGGGLGTGPGEERAAAPEVHAGAGLAMAKVSLSW